MVLRTLRGGLTPYETFASGGRHPAARFVVRLRDHGGREVVVPPNRTALEALQPAGVSMLSDCLRGECGLCVADVLERDGEIDHRDVFLSEEQQEQGAAFCTCVSRVAGAPSRSTRASGRTPAGAAGATAEAAGEPREGTGAWQYAALMAASTG